MKHLKWLAPMFLGIIFISCGSKTEKIDGTKSKSTSEKPPIQVEGFIVTPSLLNASVLIAGTLLPFEETEIHPEVAGKVVQLSIREGAFVRRGTLLVKMFDGDLRAQLNKLNIQLKIAEKTRDRQNELLKIGGISQQDFDMTFLNVSTIKADMEILRAAINKTVIRAPFDGKLGFKNISMGAYITPQTIITTISQVGKLKLQLSVPEKYANKVKLGSIIHFTTATSDKKYSAKIIATEPGITQENRSLKILALVENIDNNITPGGFANIDFNIGDNTNAIMLPTQAIIPKARDKEIILYRGGKASFNTVVTGIRDSSKVEIISGVAIGDTVITTGLLSIKPGSKIKISSFKK
jgi:membrane fusion protein (multidrug efflux system)